MLLANCKKYSDTESDFNPTIDIKKTNEYPSGIEYVPNYYQTLLLYISGISKNFKSVF